MLGLKRNEERVVIVLIVALIAVIIACRFIVFKTDSVRVTDGGMELKMKEDEPQGEQQNEKIYVYITGEVKKPGLYILKTGDRLADAVSMAGGFTGDADAASVNLAEKVRDEQYINIIKKDHDTAQTVPGNPVKGGKININAATAGELDDFLPGIGETYANNIVNYRNKVGRFKSIDEITRVDGIGPKRFEAIKDLVTIN